MFRQGARQKLEADIHTNCGLSWWLWKCPSALVDIVNQRQNVFEAEFTCEDNGIGIRGVRFIRNLTDFQYRDYRIKAT